MVGPVFKTAITFILVMAVVGSAAAATSDAELTRLADLATELMAELERSPEHQGLQNAFWEVVQEIYRAEWPDTAPQNVVFNEVLVTADNYARAGDGSMLEAIMMASFGPYGRTAEGSEGFKDILWANLELNPGLTIAVLAEIGSDNCRRLVDEVYTEPPHEYDFAGIAEALRRRWPDQVQADVDRIVSVLERMAD